jgi:hypothetical protein
VATRWAGRSTRRWREYTRPTVLNASDICHWCGHPGSNAVDHHPIPLSTLLRTAPELAEDPGHCAPIHGREGCPFCPLRAGRRRVCNSEKGDKVNATPPVNGSRDW